MRRWLARWPDAVGTLVAGGWPIALTLAVLGNPSRYDPYGVYSGAGRVRLHQLRILPTTDPNIYSTAYTLGVRSASLLVHGHLPWWNSFEGLGTPLIGEFESGGLFPFTPLLLAHDGSLVFHLALEAVAGLATYWLLRELRCNPVVAALGGMLFATNGTFAWLANAAFNPVCFVPLMLLGLERCRRLAAESRGGGWRWLAIGTALALVAGFIETAALALVFVAVLALQRGCTIDPRRAAAFARKTLLGLGVGIALAAPVLIAFDDYLRSGYVHLHGGDAAARHLTDTYVAMTVAPYLFGRIGENAYPGIHNMWGAIGGYAGFALLALAVASLFGKRDRGLRIVLAVWVFLSITDSVGMTPVRQLFSSLPVLQHIVLYRYLPPTWELALVVLAALALRDVATATRTQSLTAIATGVLSASCLLLLGVGLAPRVVQATRATTSGSFHLSELLVLVVAAGLLLAILVPRVLRTALLGAVAVAEAAILFAVPLAAWPASSPIDTAMVHYLTTHLGSARFFSLGPPGANFGSQVGARQLDVVDLPVPKSSVPIYRGLDHYEDPTVFIGVHGPSVVAPPVPILFFHNLARYEAVGVKYVVAPPSIHLFARHAKDDRLVFRDRYFDIWRLDTFRALVRTPSCTFTTRTEDSYVVECPHPSALLRDELYLPGWSATVNGVATPVRDRDAFQSVALPKGRSVVALTFLPPRAGLGGVAALLGAATLLVPYTAIARRRRKRRTRAPKHAAGASQDAGTSPVPGRLTAPPQPATGLFPVVLPDAPPDPLPAAPAPVHATPVHAAPEHKAPAHAAPERQAPAHAAPEPEPPGPVVTEVATLEPTTSASTAPAIEGGTDAAGSVESDVVTDAPVDVVVGAEPVATPAADGTHERPAEGSTATDESG